MSLDVTLYTPFENQKCTCKCGHEHTVLARTELYWANITHNLGEMAKKAGIYEALWRPYRLHPEFKPVLDDKEWEYDFEAKVTMYAKDIISIVEKGLADLKARPDYFKQFDAENGWGLYENFVPFVEKYLEACKEYPDSIINADR
jgi:hypothetical protein